MHDVVVPVTARRVGVHHYIEPWRVGRPAQGARYMLDEDTIYGARFEVVCLGTRGYLSAYIDGEP